LRRLLQTRSAPRAAGGPLFYGSLSFTIAWRHLAGTDISFDRLLSLLLQAWLIVAMDQHQSGDIPGIVILGPTASGKTRLALDLAHLFNGEIVSCDALQVYRHMDIGTAKASKSEQERVRHHLIDVQDPDLDFSAGDYQRLARKAIQEIHGNGHVPFVVGGTGFYLRALIAGLFEGPGRSNELRTRMRNIIRRKNAEVLHRSLQRVDSLSAARIAPTDAERIIRAYEVYLLTGKTMTWWQQQARDAFAGYRWLKIGIEIPRDALYARINQRVERMFEGGLQDEVRNLLHKFQRHAHAFKAIGYRQAIDCLDGKLTLAQAIEETQKESRHYAKRQLTWFRSDREIHWLNGQLGDAELRKQAADLISDWLQVGG
jgi:tRNA dimethylallyltransferase